MKKNKALLLLIVTCLSACCELDGDNFSWDKYKNSNVAMSLESAKFKSYKLSSETDSSIQSLLDAINNIVENNGSIAEFESYYLDLANRVPKIINSYMIASTKYYAYNDQSYGIKANEYYSLYSKIVNFILSMDEKISHASKEFKTAYFGDMTDEEIQEYINANSKKSIETEYQEIFKGYQDEGNQLYTNYINGYSENLYLEDGYDCFIRYIRTGDEFAKKMDYKNYLEYSYANEYSRDYTPTDAMNFVTYVKKYFVPIIKKYPNINAPSNCNSNLVSALSSKNFCNSTTDMSEMFLSYAEEMGGKYLEAYNNTFKYGYYCFSDNNYSMGTAYQWSMATGNDSILYFSKNYQDILGVVHEFGHLYSAYASNGERDGDAYDLKETYSQADEFTFLNYLLTNKKGSSDETTYQFFADRNLYRNISSIINQACITEIENFAFSNPTISKDDLKLEVEQIIKSYDGTASKTYFMAPCICEPCYYVSYSTSLMEACQFLNMDFEDAKTNYKNLVENSKEMTMVERWKSAGLTSPFEETTFKNLAATFTEIAEKYN